VSAHPRKFADIRLRGRVFTKEHQSVTDVIGLIDSEGNLFQHRTTKEVSHDTRGVRSGQLETKLPKMMN
jgi:hypothetical protein